MEREEKDAGHLEHPCVRGSEVSDSDEGGEQFDIDLGEQIDVDLTVPLEI
jgi:hypothetical protein